MTTIITFIYNKLLRKLPFGKYLFRKVLSPTVNNLLKKDSFNRDSIIRSCEQFIDEQRVLDYFRNVIRFYSLTL